ncbi:hypothetical protein C7N43_38660, partial [Sphingobacteriales bacterium UPWRP_1]
MVNDQNLIEFLICPQFTLPSIACGFGTLAADGCWHYWGGVVSPPQPPYPVPVNLACLLDQPGDYVFIAQTWNDYPLNGIPDGLTGAQSDTTCINVQDSLSLTVFPVTISPAAPYCTNTPITFSIPNNIAASADFIQWGVIEPGSTTETMYACSAMSCTTFILNPTMGGIYTVNLYVYFNGTACPGQVEYHMPVEVTDNPCVCIAPQNFLIDPNSSGIANNASTDNRPAYVVGSTAIWTPTNNPFITNYGAISGSDIFLDVDLIIPSGIQLTITGMNIHFAPDRRILVQRGAILNLLGTAENPTALQGACNSMWQGVQVEGPGQNGARVFSPGVTTPATYGILNSRNANIHDAIFGAISTNLPLMDVNTLSAQILSLPTNPIVPSGWGYTPSMVTSLLYNGVLTSAQAFAKAGGMLKIDYDTYFINCLEGVNMPWYKTSCNISPPSEPCECFVRSATFNTSQLAYPFNAGLTAPVKTEAGIHLLNYLPNSSNRLALDNNQFNNPNYGIRAAGLQNTDVQNNLFTNCTVGLSVLNYSYFSEFMTHNILVTNNQFNNCQVSLQASRTQLKVTGNFINNLYVPPTGTLATANPIGMFIHGSNANVTNNNINYTRVGVALLSNNTDPVYISNNQFNVNAVGVYSLGNNKAAQILCNDFYNYAVAIGAQNYTSTTFAYPSEEGFLSDQGDCNPITPRPADNLFSMPLSAVLSAEIAAMPYPAANNFIYWYRNAPGFVPLTTYGEVSPQECFSIGEPLPPREDLCGLIGGEMVMDDNDIRNLTDENIMNYEALKKARYYVYDQNNRPAAEGLLEDIQTYLAERMLLNSYLIQGNLESANQQLANLPNATEEEQQFRQLYQIYANWRQTGRTLFEITPEEENTVRQIAAATTQTATEARTLLYLRYGEEYPIDLPPLSNLIDPALFENVYINFKGGATNNLDLSTGIGKPYPNPAKSGFSIDYNLGKGIAATVQFLSITGNIQKTVTLTGSGTFNVDIAEWISGMYYYRI